MEKHGEAITAEEFLAALTENCEKVELVYCKIKGEVDISKAGIERDKDCKYPIDKRVICKNCVFTDDVYFYAAKFQEIATFGGFGPLNNPKRTVFNGNANFSEAIFKKRVDFREVTFEKYASFKHTVFKDDVTFEQSIFWGDAINTDLIAFEKATFEREVDFTGAIFKKGDVTFNDVNFKQAGIFDQVNFERNVFFKGVGINCEKTPLRFEGVRYWSDKVFHRLSTQFYLDSGNIDAVSNPFFKRYVADQQFIRAVKSKHCILAFIWGWSSDYGRSIGLWTFWSFVVVFFFALAYAHEHYDWIYWVFGLLGMICFAMSLRYIWMSVVGDIQRKLLLRMKEPEAPLQKARRRLNVIRNVIDKKWKPCLKVWFGMVLVIFAIHVMALSIQHLDFDVPIEGRKIKIMPYLYLSVVTFTTLGAGSITPTNIAEDIWLMVEVMLGYVMLGVLISIFANKLARRS